MKEYDASNIRNFALVGHGSAGKTILAESMLACSGAINRIGSVEQGSTVSDYHEDEQQRQISIHTTSMYAEWQSCKLNILDSPGYADFVGEALSALRVSDSVILTVHGAHGIELGTEQMWEKVQDLEMPAMAVVNVLDAEYVKFDEIVEELTERFGKRFFPLTLPVNPGPGFNQMVDVLARKLHRYDVEGIGKFESEDLPGDWQDRVEELHQQLMENVAESDDELLEKFFEEGELSDEEIRNGLKGALRQQTFIPVFAVASGVSVGVPQLMDFLSAYAPSPCDGAVVTATRSDDQTLEIGLDDGSPLLSIFKTVSEPHVGELSFFRLYSGKVETGMDLHNTSRNHSERVGQIFQMNGKDRSQVKAVQAGDLAAFVKLKGTHTCDTLSDPKTKLKLPGIDFPAPNLSGALKLKSKGEEEKMSIGLSTLHEEDPTFIYRPDPELHQTLIFGQGELHLQIITERLKNRFQVEVELVQPKIPYRETIRRKGDSKYRHKKQTGGAGQFAEVWMRLEPGPRDSGIDFNESLVGQNVDRVFVPSVDKGVQAASGEGVLAGYRVVDVKIDFYDGKQHPVDSKDVAFQIAGKNAFKQGILECDPCLLEPIYDLEIKVPEEHMGDVMGDISGRRGKIQGMDASGQYQIIRAQVPQRELYSYATILRSITGGRGWHQENFSHYEEMPRDLEQKVINESNTTDS
ncbi:MAG: elongation factor G [SAR324 cluster bacterium]|jgi:elongation factor G|nr:elongation factor G [Deltaproteobacteria bacterium]MDP6092958.1 elongation factor G [SAR324 cluster bacterium]MBP43737.1 elongation factor G [Deltaproteobacteria bacterium]MDP6248099.1 elongation factor G [SAR324 cluster bacterium]MDP6464471.1 elongation factor G [SAR324 cluster bacterium]|tara:strand:- start:515 stop:2590 length:2076 start_codon:yes stop_codon:yes gene_type:complete